MDNGACSYRRFLDGDESAFDEIMKELFDGLVFFINRYVYDIHTAEDLAIDVFSELIVHRRRYNFRVSMKTYLFMLGRSRALDHIRRRKVIPFVEQKEVAATEVDTCFLNVGFACPLFRKGISHSYVLQTKIGHVCQIAGLGIVVVAAVSYTGYGTSTIICTTIKTWITVALIYLITGNGGIV